MRIFVAGASGVIGRRLIPILVEEGHEVAGTTRSPEKASLLAELGAKAVVIDVYDAAGLKEAVVDFAPEVVLHELTDLPDDASQLPGSMDANARIRTEGTRNLIEAARAADARRFLAQSLAWELPPGAGADAVADLERQVAEVDGTVLRYGQFYGPDTYHPDTIPDEPRVHIDAAARLTAAAIDSPPGIVTITD